MNLIILKRQSLTNQKCMIQLTVINLHPNEYSQEFYYYPFVVKLDRCVGGCNTVNDLSNKVCVPNKNRIDYRKKMKNKLTKDISCESKCKSDGRRCNSNQKWNNGKC